MFLELLAGLVQERACYREHAPLSSVFSKLLGELVEHLGEDRPAAVARELTKRFEEVRRGTLAELQAWYAEQPKVRGEIVVVVGGKP